MTRLASALQPLLRRLEPERAHRLALSALRLGLAGQGSAPDPMLAVDVLGRRFPSPVGLAAGFDKDADALAPLLRLGFGFIEAGTVTPLPQLGNPRPRLFRLEPDAAVINRMGFNGRGIEPYLRRLAAFRAQRGDAGRGLVGANIGVNKVGADPARDYPRLVAAVAPLADYVAINVSSPNTPGLRDLQTEDRLRAILRAVRAAVTQRPPLLVKISPDLDEHGIRSVTATCVEEAVDGLIVANTTVDRLPALTSSYAPEAGGLSGRPLRDRAARALAHARAEAGTRLVLIGCGGIASGRDALDRLRAGASLVQVYTAFAYGGPAFPARLNAELAAALRQDGFSSVAEAIGVDARAAPRQKIPSCST